MDDRPGYGEPEEPEEDDHLTTLSTLANPVTSSKPVRHSKTLPHYHGGDLRNWQLRHLVHHALIVQPQEASPGWEWLGVDTAPTRTETNQKVCL